MVAAPRSFLALAACALLTGCYMRVPETLYSRCDALGAEGWTARVDPGGQADGKRGRRILVSGSVTLPSAGYSVSLDKGPIERTQPRALQVLLRTDRPDAPTAQALTRYPVEAVMPYDETIEAVRLRCGDGILAEMSTIEPAPAG